MTNKIKNHAINLQTEILRTFPTLNIKKEEYFKIEGKLTSRLYLFYKNSKGYIEMIKEREKCSIESYKVLRLLFFAKSKTKITKNEANSF